MSELWPSVKVSTLTEQAYDILRERVLSGRVPPGSFIREQEVSDALRISRTPVREALGRLASEGFLERIPHRGFRMPGESVPDLLELYPIISTLEVLAARLSIPRLAADDLRQLKEINASYKTAKERNETRGGIEANDRFHHLLSDKCPNRRLCEMLDELRSQVKRLELAAFRDSEEWEGSIHEHDEILSAIELGDHDQALAILERNRLGSYNYFRERLGVEPRESTERSPSEVA